MTYQHISQRAIQIALTLMLVLFSWVSYHQFMGAMPMETMAHSEAAAMDCLAFCFMANNVDVSAFIQFMYYSFAEGLNGLLALLAFSALAFLTITALRHQPTTVSPVLQKLKRYYQQHRWRFKLFVLWTQLYQQGIVAPQVYS